jgi:Clp amino terminal domain, pathogenicity island component
MSVRLQADVRRAVLRFASAEAAGRGSGRIGTQDLLLAVLVDPASDATRILGVDLDAARGAVKDLDRAALARVGVDLGRVELEPRPPGRGRRPLTAGARGVFVRAVHLARRDRTGRIEMRHLTASLLACRRPDPAAEVLDALGVDREEASRRAGV